jgi:ABC-2 type transport system ATP-binding protein
VSDAIITVASLIKRFHTRPRTTGWRATLGGLFSRATTVVKAVDDISFTVAPGEIVGYLGPNGAGKSTTIKILTGLLVPTSGHVEVRGAIPWRDRERYVAGIGAVFGQRTTLWWDLPVADSLDLLQHVYRIPPARYRANLDDFRALLDLDEFINSPVRSLSLGQRMRADLCAAMIHDPALLFLDEPTIGLDVVAKERIRQFIRHINRERGTTVLLTTHDLQDVEKLCERALIIDRGHLLYDGALASLLDRFGGERELVVDLAEPHDHPLVDGAVLVSLEGQRATYRFKRGVTSASTLIGQISAKYRVQDLSVREPQIEDTIRRIYLEGLLHQQP